MAEATQTAVESGAPAPDQAQPEPVAEPITSEKISEFRTKRDRASIRKIIDEASKPESDTPKPEEQKPAEAAPQAKPTAAEVKKFKDKFHGQEFEIDDTDGFLGYKDLESLKKENAHKRLYLAELEKKEREAREGIGQRDRELENYKRQYKEAQDKLAALQVKPATPVQPIAEAKPEPKVELPKAPKKPEAKFDPLDEESQVVWQKYFDDVSEYNQKVDGYLQNFKPEIRTEIPQEFKSEVESLRSKVNEYEQLFTSTKEQNKKAEFDGALAKKWNERAEFQSTHKDFATVKPLKEIDKELLVWSDRLANLNGIQQPSKPFNNQDPDWINYENQRFGLINKYMAGDQKVVEAAGTFTPPEEYKNFAAVIELEEKKRKMIEDGILGPKATLHDAFLKDFDSSGKMAETIGAVEKENLLRGAKSVTEAIDGAKRDFAVSLPPGVGGKGKESVATDISNLSQTEIEKILGATSSELLADPDLRRKKALIMAQIT
jgi:hypothetical protein